MKFINKKISIGLSIIIIFIIASIAYSIGYRFAMDRFNNIISYNREKQQIYYRLSEIDTSIRREYIGNIDESNLTNNICNGYINGLNDPECKYLTQQEYKELLNSGIKSSPIKSDVLEDNVGYIKILSITEEFSSSIINLINSLYLEKNINNFIIDIRNVKNGEIEYIQNLLDYTLNDGSTISTVAKDENNKQIYKTKHKDINILPFNCCILVNENTSGISEVLAYSLKNITGSKLIGNSTAGKIYKNKVINFQSDEHVLIFPAFKFKINEILLSEKINVDININVNDNEKDLIIKNQITYDQDSQLQAALKSF